jgi:glycosyltransferase involved in cell wall biosynthesis/peptidoglycan/xylan/chitin deacetylase (PgdA/CDA1 family)
MLTNLWSRMQKRYRRKAASLSFKRPLRIAPQRPLISFTFDDFPKSALMVGGAILNSFGVAGTYYASFGLLGKESDSGRMFDESDLAILLEQGHELGCHTFGHCDSWETGTSTFEQSIIDNRVVLNRLIPGAEFKTFSYPISLPRPLTKARTATHFRCCRGGGQTLNAGTIDLNQLSAYFLEKNRHDLQGIRDLIDKNREAKGWLIFATHDIAEDPTPFGCGPAFFRDVVDYAVRSGAQVLPVAGALAALGGTSREQSANSPIYVRRGSPVVHRSASNPALVSILIPAYNAGSWIADTLRSALSQTWPRKEIIVVDDGSSDDTLAIVRRFEANGVRVVTQKNQGAATARNHAYSLSRGDYIQWLDADDLLAPDKIASQMVIANSLRNSRVLLSSSFGRFRYRWYRAEFAPSALWSDLSPLDWLLHKMGDNLYMQTATWLVSRELSEEAGPWDTRMLSDDDGEFFCRVLLKSDGVRFVPGRAVYYRGPGHESLAYIGHSKRKCDALWISMKLHIGYVRSLRDDQNTRMACLAYLQRNAIHFHPNMPEIVEEMRQVARDLGGELKDPYLSPKYSLVRAVFGWQTAKGVAVASRRLRWSSTAFVDKLLFQFENRKRRSTEQFAEHATPPAASEQSVHSV